MPHYHLWCKDDSVADSYWVFAASPSEARRIIALNVPDAADAEDQDKFQCAITIARTPPSLVIYRRLNRPLDITKR
jgi:hypothetical protein